MEKSKLGISVGLLGMLVFLSGYLGITVLILVAGYIFLREENETLRKNALYSIALFIAFFVAGLCLDVLHILFIDLINFRSWMSISTYYGVINGILSTLRYILNLVEMAVFGLFAAGALFGKSIKIGFLDKFAQKHL